MSDHPALTSTADPHGNAPASPSPLYQRFAAWSERRVALLVLFLWAVAEGAFWPIVPDPLLGLMGVATPRRAPGLFLLVLGGGLLGVLLIWPILLAAPALTREFLIALPALDAPMLETARARVADGSPLSVVQWGAGTPLKSWAWAWAIEGGALGVFLLGAALNRLTRILPLFLFTTALGQFGGARLRRHGGRFIAGYLLSWLLFYCFYWTAGA